MSFTKLFFQCSHKIPIKNRFSRSNGTGVHLCSWGSPVNSPTMHSRLVHQERTKQGWEPSKKVFFVVAILATLSSIRSIQLFWFWSPTEGTYNIVTFRLNWTGGQFSENCTALPICEKTMIIRYLFYRSSTIKQCVIL